MSSTTQTKVCTLNTLTRVDARFAGRLEYKLVTVLLGRSLKAPPITSPTIFQSTHRDCRQLSLLGFSLFFFSFVVGSIGVSLLVASIIDCPFSSTCSRLASSSSDLA